MLFLESAQCVLKILNWQIQLLKVSFFFFFTTAHGGISSPAACRFREKKLFFAPGFWLVQPDEKGAWLASESWHQSALLAVKGREIFTIPLSGCYKNTHTNTYTLSERSGTHRNGEWSNLFHTVHLTYDLSSRHDRYWMFTRAAATSCALLDERKNCELFIMLCSFRAAVTWKRACIQSFTWQTDILT